MDLKEVELEGFDQRHMAPEMGNNGFWVLQKMQENS
jgi:hypothetical protein